jgi:hypothetical protein
MSAGINQECRGKHERGLVDCEGDLTVLRGANKKTSPRYRATVGWLFLRSKREKLHVGGQILNRRFSERQQGHAAIRHDTWQIGGYLENGQPPTALPDIQGRHHARLNLLNRNGIAHPPDRFVNESSVGVSSLFETSVGITGIALPNLMAKLVKIIER